MSDAGVSVRDRGECQRQGLVSERGVNVRDRVSVIRDGGECHQRQG